MEIGILAPGCHARGYHQLLVILMRLSGQLLWDAEEGTAGSALAPGESCLVGGVGQK